MHTDSSKTDVAPAQTGWSTSVLGSNLGRVSGAAAVANVLYQLATTATVTLLSLSVVGVTTFAFISYSGGSSSSGEEVLAGGVAAVVVLLLALVPMTSALAALYVAVALVRGGRRASIYVASVVSLAGPFSLVCWGAFLAVASVEWAFAVSGVAMVGSLACIMASILAVVAVNRAESAHLD